MQCKIIISTIVFSFVHLVIYGQHSFDSIKICHENKKLKEITIGEYHVKLQKGQLHSFVSNDSVLSYEATDKILMIKDFAKANFLRFQLLKNGIQISTKDTSFVLASPNSIGLKTVNGSKETLAIYSMGLYSFSLSFNDNSVTGIHFPIINKFIDIGLDEIKGTYKWGIVIGSEGNRNRLLLSYMYENPSMVDISDSKNKIGIRLVAEKGSGIFTTLYGTRLLGDQTSATKENLIRYSNKGILRKSTGFNLTCD